jgi:photosystem II stability/assembly factor-like uncharacterized protein
MITTVKAAIRVALCAAALLLFLSSLSAASPPPRADAGREPSQATSTHEVRVEASEEGHDAGPEFEQEYFRQWIGGTLDPQRLHKMWDEVLSVPSEPPPGAGDAINSWQLVGPLYMTNSGGGYMTGRVRDIESSTTRVLAASGGLWRFNFGPIPMSEAVNASWFGSFASNPGDPNTILVGTGEYDIGTGTGIYKTVDGGNTWIHCSMGSDPYYISRVRWSPNGATAYAATSSGLYRSTDAGQSWTLALSGNATDIGTVNSRYYPNLLYVPIQDNGLFRSSDAGVTWTQFTTGGIPFSGTGEGAVSTPPHNLFVSGWIYVSFDNAGVWRSQDGGGTWTNITPASDPHRFWYANVIAASPSDQNYVLLGGVGARLSTDAGATWTSLVTPNLHADYHAFSWDADGVGVWAGNDGGWFHSANHGQTWDSSSNVMPITQFYSIACENTEVGYMIGGTQDNDLTYTPNEALFWTVKSEGDATGSCVDLYNPAQMWGIEGVYGGNYSYERQHTTDGGATWHEVDNGIDPNTHAGQIRIDNVFHPWLVSSAGPYVYDSTDGVNWTKSNTTPFPATVGDLTSSSRDNPNAVAYATMASVIGGQALFVRDGGAWYDRSAGLPSGAVLRKVVPHPWTGNYASEAWALMNGTSTPGQKVFHTTNRGITWTNVTGNLPNVPIGDLVVNPHNTSQLFLGTFLGCYRSLNGGASWERWNNGLTPAVMVTEMSYIDLTGSGGPFYVVAATHGRSVWERDISGSDPLAVWDSGPNGPRLHLDMTSPNPFSQQATFQFALPRSGPTRMDVYDVRGRLVSTALNSVLSAGEHQVDLNGGALAPGVYFCRLQGGGESAVRRITVIR